MKQINLRELPIVNTSRGFAHLREDGSIRRYYVPHAYLMTSKVDLNIILREKIAEVEGLLPEELDLVFLNRPTPKYTSGDISSSVFQVSTLNKELTALIPKDVINALNKATYNQINQQVNTPLSEPKLYERIFLNPIRNKIQNKYKSIPDFARPSYIKIIEKLIDKLSVTIYEREILTCRYLGVRAFEEDVNVAVAKLSLELEKFQKLGLIRGQLAKPMIINFINIIGDDKIEYAVLSYFHVPMKHANIVDNLSKISFREGAEPDEMASLCKRNITIHDDVYIKAPEKKELYELKESGRYHTEMDAPEEELKTGEN